MTPLLVVGLGVDLVAAIATDLLFAAVVKCCASAVHLRGHHVDWKIIKRLWIGSIPACLIVGWLIAARVTPEQNAVLLKAIGALIAVSGCSMVFGTLVQRRSTVARLADPARFKKPQAVLTVIAGAAIGSVIAATSIGAGAIGAVILRALYPLRMTPIKLVATDTMFAIPVALLAGMSFAVEGRTDWNLLGLLLLGAVPTAVVASALAARLNAAWLKSIVGVVLLVIAAKMLLA